MLAALLALTALTADAATVRVEVTPKFQNGVHMACETAFDIIVEDTAYHHGQAVAVAGSFSLYNWPEGGGVSVGMKLGVSADSETYTAPSNAYVVNGYSTNLSEQKAQTEAELPGFRLFIFDAGGTQTVDAISRIAFERRLDVAYTLNGGSMPMAFPVTLTAEQAQIWSDCVDALVTRDA